MEKAVVTPWEVRGHVDYQRLIKEFGLEEIDSALLSRIKKHTKEINHLLRRGIFFAHRDLNWLLSKYEKGEKFFLYTGRAPSGPVHIGHLIPWMFTKWLQDKFNAELWFQFPDEEKFLFKDNLTLDDTKKWTNENMLDVIALGFDHKKTNFLIDTQHAGLMYKEAIKVAKKITFSTLKAAFGFTNETNVGSIFYTSMQAVPVFLPCVIKKRKIPCLIPLGFDQDPHFRVARDVYPRLGYDKPAIIHCRFLPPLSGSGKLSSSEGQAIYTTDSPEEVEMKIKKYAFSGGKDTLKEHREKGGNPDIDVSYQWLTFLEDDDRKLKKIYDDYKSGAMLSSELKEILIKKLNSFLKIHQKKRKQAEKRIDKFIYK